MAALGWEIGGEAWVWRRQLWVWEVEILRECQDLLHDFLLQAQCSDTWLWRHDPDHGYSVRGACQLLTMQQHVTLDAAEDLIWHRLWLWWHRISATLISIVWGPCGR
ncbi:hypothetical protein QL285_078345 [Trifolium repens]|nr:hypothetical protein QL285_078345 [Trifolium repens]